MSFLRAIKNLGYGDVENLVREATSNSKRDTPRDVLDDIARLTYARSDFEQLMPMLDRRLNDRTRQWRHVFKSLQLAHFLLLAGSPAAVQYFRDNAYLVKTLREFQYTDSSGQDQGQLVRDKAREVTALLQNKDLLEQARARFNGQKPRRRSSGSSSLAQPGSTPPAFHDNDSPDLAGAARRRREADDAERARRAEADALARALEENRKSAEAEAQALALRRAQAEAERKRQADADAQALADKQAADALQAQQLEIARWQLDQSRMNSMYGGMMYPQYTGMYVQPQMTAYQMPMATGWEQAAAPVQTVNATGTTDSFVAGSNNPFAPSSGSVAAAPASQVEDLPPPSRTPSLTLTRDVPSRSQSSNDVRFATPPNAQPPLAHQVRTKPGSAAYMDQLDTLLAQSDGIDTFGNAGNQRLGHFASNRIDLFAGARPQASPFA